MKTRATVCAITGLVLSIIGLITSNIAIVILALLPAVIGAAAIKEMDKIRDDSEIRKRMENEAILARNDRDEAEFRMILDREKLFREYCQWEVDTW